MLGPMVAIYKKTVKIYSKNVWLNNFYSKIILCWYCCICDVRHRRFEHHLSNWFYVDCQSKNRLKYRKWTTWYCCSYGSKLCTRGIFPTFRHASLEILLSWCDLFCDNSCKHYSCQHASFTCDNSCKHNSCKHCMQALQLMQAENIFI